MAISNRIISTLVLQLLFFNMSFSQDSNGDFRSLTSGPWSSLSSWQEFNGSWGPATHAPDFLDEKITIRSSHTITVSSADFNVDQTTVANGGILTINSGRTIFAEDDFSGTSILVESGGTMNVNGTLDLNNLIISLVEIDGSLNNTGLVDSPDPSYLSFVGSSALYSHNFTQAGIIPLAFWDTGSTCRITGMTSNNPNPPSNLDQSFWNFDWNCPSQGNGIANLNGQLIDVSGNLSLTSTGGRNFALQNAGAGYTLNIGGNFTTTSSVGSVVLAGNTSSNTAINITGNIVFAHGNPTTLVGGNGDICDINISGNVTSSSQFTGAFGAIMGFTFNGGGAQSYTYTGTTLNRPVNFTVSNNSTLNLNTSTLNGTGTFTLNAGCTVNLGSLSTSGAVSGNIAVTGAKTFVSGSTVIYNGSGAQFMGASQPSAAGVTTHISNASGVSIVSGVNPTIGGNLIIDTGSRLNLGSQTLTLAGTISGAGTINANGTGSLTINGSGNFGTLNFFNNPGQLQNLTLNRASGTITLGSDLNINGAFTQTDGDLDISNRIFQLLGDYNRVTGNLITNVNTALVFAGSGTLPASIAITGGSLFALSLNRVGATLTTNASFQLTTLNLDAGTLNNTGTITMTSSGTVTRTAGTLSNPLSAVTSYTLIYNNGSAISTGPEVPSGPILLTGLNNLTKQNTGTLTVSSALTINGVLTLAGPGFDAGIQSVALRGNFVSNASSTLTSSIFSFSGTTTITGTTPPVFGIVNIVDAFSTLSPGTNFQINGNLSNNGTLNTTSGTVIFGGNTTVTGSNPTSFANVLINNGATLVGPTPAGGSDIMNVSGTWTNDGTFTAGAGASGSTVVFTGNSTIAGTNSTTFNNLTISGTLTAPASLSLMGHLRINGTFNANSGTVAFVGTANQRIDRTAGAAATIDFFNITVNKTSGTFNVFSTIPSTIFRVENNFTISQNGASSPDVDFDGPSNTGTLVLRSTASRAAKITAVPAGVTVAGLVTAERYIDNSNGTRAWRYFASPLVGATVADWQGEIQITGQFSNPSTGTGSNNPSLYRWTETNGGLASNRWNVWPNNVAQPASSFAITNGRGYSLFVRNTGTPTMDVRGTLATGNINIGLTRTGTEVDAAGFNLVGNPYPAPIDWDLVTLPGGVSSTIALLDEVENAGLGAGTFVYYVQGGPAFGNFDGIIASSQAFWVNLTSGSTATLTLTESNKASDINPIVVRERSIANMLRIKLFGIDSNDETVVYFNEEASSNVDIEFDARKFLNQNINLYSYLETNPDAKYAINGINNLDCSQLIKLGINDLDVDFLPSDPDISSSLASGEDITPLGQYTFEFSEMESFDTDYRIYLIDKFSGESIDVLEQSNYSFQVTEDLNSKGDNRFELLISKAEVKNDKLINAADICSGSNAKVEILNAEEGVTYYASLGGNTVSELSVGSGSNLILNVTENNLSQGENNLIIYGRRGGCDAVPMLQAVSLTKEPLLEVSSTSNAIQCKEGSATLSASGAISGNYRWYEGTDSNPIAGATDAQFITPVLQKSKTYYVSIVNSLGCEGSKKQVKAEVINYDDISVEINDNTLISSYSEGNQWYKDGTIIQGATTPTYTPLESGYYEVQVSFGECSTSAGRSFVVTETEDPFFSNGLIVYYPNPVTDVLTVELNDADLIDPRIVDVMGREIGIIHMRGDINKRVGIFDFSDKAQGIYILQVTTKGGAMFNKRITKK